LRTKEEKSERLLQRLIEKDSFPGQKRKKESVPPQKGVSESGEKTQGGWYYQPSSWPRGNFEGVENKMPIHACGGESFELF